MPPSRNPARGLVTGNAMPHTIPLLPGLLLFFDETGTYLDVETADGAVGSIPLERLGSIGTHDLEVFRRWAAKARDERGYNVSNVVELRSRRHRAPG